MNLDTNKPPAPVFIKKIATIEKYKNFIKEHKIKLPIPLMEKRTHFVKWFLEENSSNTLIHNINELSKNYLYTSSRTIEDILFNNETKS